VSRRALKALLVVGSVAALAVSVPGPVPAAAAERPPTELVLDRYSGYVGESVYARSATPCPAGTTSVGLNLFPSNPPPGHWSWGTNIPAWSDGHWGPVAVPFNESDLVGRQAVLVVNCHPASGPALMGYRSLFFEVKNGAFWWLPDNQNQRLVTRVYHDLFDRDPDPSGLEGWTAALDRGVARGAVANAITSSHEFRAALVSDAYGYYLERGPDPGGLEGWVGYLNRGATIEQLEAGIMASPEYFGKAGGGNDPWVRRMYADVLGRTPGNAEVAYWTNALGMGRIDRYTAAMGFLISVEHLQAVVTAQYEHLLGRGTDQAGRDGWVAAIQRGMRLEELVAGITGSIEYAYWSSQG
jgi:hypothetical protein